MQIFKRMLIVSLAFVAILATGNMSVHADTAETLVVHYYRYDEDYSEFDTLWLWPHEPDSLGGSRYEFDDEGDFGAKQTIDLNDTNLYESTTIGLIIFTGTWGEGRDVDGDRFVDMTNPNAEGEVHIYLVQGEDEIYYDESEADTSQRIFSAGFAEDGVSVDFTATADAEEDDVSLLADGDPVSFSGFTMENGEGSLTLEEDVDLTKNYQLVIDFGDDDEARSTVRFDGFYNSDEFNDAYAYDGELGPIYSESETEFKLWAPISDSVTLNLYTMGHDADTVDDDGNEGVDDPYETYEMDQKDKGVWSVTVDGDLDRTYYTYTVNNDGTEHEVVDPYTYASGVNGERGMVINFDRYNPDGWEYGTSPDNIDKPTDSIIYELHVRDLTSHESWNGNEDWRGKFLGLTERGTTHNGLSTGLDHILDLGVTHVQLLPFFDHGIIDETRHNDPTYEGHHDGIFNWGYMPQHFNNLEGSYATDPYNGEVRVEEFKEVVQTFHENDLRVVMDVVYNHTGQSADSNFDRILPGYYFRMNEDGTFSNGSGTGNETASERAMFRKFMVDSLKFWVEEYNIDGFRFDLMRLHDVETMNIIRDELHEIDDSILIFGEPWDAGGSELPSHMAADHDTLDQMPGIGAFNDTTRDGIKGSVFESSGQGFVQGNDYATPRVMYGIAGGTSQSGLAIPGDALSPSQTINYVTAHDNNTLHDKLRLSSGTDEETFARMHRQSNGILFASQGVTFLHAGVEMMRTKPCVEPESGENTCAGGFDHNSYRSPDQVNQLDWNWKSEHQDTFEYYRDMIELRKMKDVFRLDTQEAIAEALTFGPYEPGTIQYLLNDENDDWQTIVVFHNNGSETRDFTLPSADTTFNLVATSDEVGEIDGDSVQTLASFDGGETLTLERNESRILYSNDLVETFDAEDDDEKDEGGFFSCGRRSESADAPSSISVLPMIGFIGLIAARFTFKKRK